jgi:hypothetical protein
MREYKDRVREYFSHKKGDGLILSPTNWIVVGKWEKMGIPLHIVIQGIDKTFENLRSGGLQQKRINYLGYCEPEILNSWKEYRKKNYPESDHAGSDHTGSAACTCTDAQAAYATQPARWSGPEQNEAEKNPGQEQKKIREYVGRKISLLIMQITQLMEKWGKERDNLEKDKSSQHSVDNIQHSVDNGQMAMGVIADTRQPPEDTIMGLLPRTLRAIRLEEELIHLRQETQICSRVDIESIEKRLHKLDGQLVQSLFAALPSGKRDDLLSSAEKQTRRYKNQMEYSAYQETIQAYSIELLRRELGIRQLSLYQ